MIRLMAFSTLMPAAADFCDTNPRHYLCRFVRVAMHAGFFLAFALDMELHVRCRSLPQRAGISRFTPLFFFCGGCVETVCKFSG